MLNLNSLLILVDVIVNNISPRRGKLSSPGWDTARQGATRLTRVGGIIKKNNLCFFFQCILKILIAKFIIQNVNIGYFPENIIPSLIIVKVAVLAAVTPASLFN